MLMKPRQRLFFLFSILLFALLLLAYPAFADLDMWLGAHVYALSEPLVIVSKLLSWLGGGPGSLLIVALFGIWLVRSRADWPAAIGLAGGMVACWSLNAVFKNLLQRPRPEFEHLATVSGYSLPSGHAMASLTFAIMLLLVFSQHYPARRKLWFSLAMLWVFASGFARLVLGVHFFTDILAGFALAGAIASAFAAWYLPRSPRRAAIWR